MSLSAKQTDDAGRTLLAGSFLVIAMLSVSVAMPGQTTMKFVLSKDPLFPVHFVAPTLWAFCWGVMSGLLMSFYTQLPAGFRVLGAFTGLYAFAMELNAILFTIRMYVVGLLLASRESAKEA